MDEAVLTGNITRVVENLCHDELRRSIAAWATCSASPTSPPTPIRSGPRPSSARSREAVQTLKADRKIKFQIMKDLNQAPLGEIATIYADLNQHLTRLNMVPALGTRRRSCNRGGAADRAAAKPPAQAKAPPEPPRRGNGRDGDVQAHVRQRHAGGASRRRRRSVQQAPHADRPAPAPHGGRAHGDGEFPAISLPGGAPAAAFAPLRPTPSGYVPGAPIISTPDLHEGLTRLQAGQTGFDVGGRAGRVLRHPAGPAQRPARPAGVAARREGEPARVDDHRDGRDAVRLHLRDQGSARRHQGAARAAADPGAEGGDARRRVLREEAASVAAAGQRAGAGGPRLVAGDGPGGSAVSQDRRHRPPDPRRLLRRPRDLRGAARGARGVPRGGGEGGRGEHPVDRRGDQPARPPADRARWSPRRRSSGASRATRCRTSSRRSCAQKWQSALEHVYLHEGEESEGWSSGRRDARGPGLERAAEALARGPPAPGGAAAVAAEAPVRGHAQPRLGAATSASRSWPTWSRRMRRR